VRSTCSLNALKKKNILFLPRLEPRFRLYALQNYSGTHC